MPPTSGSAIGDVDSDDYVAQVLAGEARDSSLKYSAQGLGAYMPKRPTGAAPKPNTRFLRHIIKETDTHNAALKRKEEREARERMRQLRTQATASSHDSRETRRRQSTTDDRDSRRERKYDREDRHRSHRRRPRSRSASADRERSSKYRHRHETEEDRHRSSRRSRRHRSYSRSRSRSPKEDRDSYSRRHRRHHRRRSGSPSRSRSRSPRARESRRDKYSERSSRHRSREREASRKHTTTTRKESPTAPAQQNGYDSDPLEDLVGPLPAKENAPIRSRGRGAYRPNASNIDAHFAADYDPALDVQLEDDDASTKKSTRRPVPGLMTGDDDWELALEAVRDRARWRQRGEDRLREAGFNDSFVERWKSNTTSTGAADDSEGRLEDVKWSKKGESREWDRGKFVDDEGHIDVKALW
ncbi:hypothetical protein P170DRAFT_453823 [Aspergillus steynii IBT 23096]|uniref:Uncharacterized protein n=1 Tax=Aspergillus steynii IBT 23096 TaxID=1392250 RepID=A0A2I2GHT6_9EURO|nr:uncharacterized protein P170DRAFT_453823 [Aspergillus steynii IBT 23096]PLB52440.1 hypothetical protein P170DRAFT_453823 [Aspergillus steynii IBT 23096]